MNGRGVVLASVIFAGCGGSGADPEETCGLDYDNLGGRTFVMLESRAGEDTENPLARMQFEQSGDQVKVKYTVGSLADVYTYDCELQEKGDRKELLCVEEERPQAWCTALEVHEAGLCSKRELSRLGIRNSSDEELNEAIKAARAEVSEQRNADTWDRYKLQNNNLGNKLQGRLYIQVDTRRCRLSATDMYFTIFDGKGVEDTNPVGQNAFVETQAPYMFLSCDDARNLVDLQTAALPEDLGTIPPRREHQVGSEVYYHYLGEEALSVEEGCSYSYDSYAQWRSLQQDVTVPLNDAGQLIWSATHRFGAEDVVTYNGQPLGIFHMARKKTCGGEAPETIDVLCSAGIIR